MYDGFKGLVVRLLKVPPEPAPPTGEALETFRAAKAWFAYRRIVWAIGSFFMATLMGTGAIVVLTASAQAAGFERVVLQAAAALIAVVFVAVTGIRYAIIRLDYEMRWYMVTDRSLRIREGVVGLREMTLTFANIQEIAISQGPIMRIFGVQDVMVRTAGGGAATPHTKGTFHMHVGYFRGVDNAEAIRDLIRARLEAYKDAGLGDRDDATPDAGPATLVDALAALRTETRALRDVVS